MTSSNSEIFLSYKLGGDLEKEAVEIYDYLVTRKYHIIRDKIDLPYRENVKSFMERIGTGKAVVAVISDGYMKSHNCMFEALEISKHGNVSERIFPVMLHGLDLSLEEVQNLYTDFWAGRVRELNAALLDLEDLTNRGSMLVQLQLFKDIEAFINPFATIVSTLPTITSETLKLSGIRAITDALENLFSRDKERKLS